MRTGRVRIGGRAFPVRSLNTVVIGSGAAGLNAAVRLHRHGQTDVAVLTGRFGAGASAESGSDKQTYYKLSLAGDVPDSAADMARDLAAGGSMHGDIALAEAQGSVEAFVHLVGLGVPFPHDRYGGYVGYKTDHDPRQRATSAGPLTSKLMFEALAAEVRRRRIPVFDGHEAIAVLTAGRGRGKRAIGVLALDRAKAGGPGRGFVLFNAVNVVAATGGPGGMYEHSVYPESQSGSHGLLFEAGAAAHNLTESQFGLASVKFRWNVSGTYQQAVPRYVSTDAARGGEREFLNDYFPDMGALATAVFLKGYQWPFDPRKIAGGGSSLVDLLVYEETVVKGRRVFLDFRGDPRGDGRLAAFEPRLLGPEALAYLERSGALTSTPIARLRKMNPPAVALYKTHGIDLAREPLEIAVCAQHNNGGFRGSVWWESSVRGLFPVGEVCGTHGVTRPGGSALNAGQVGSARAALFIARRRAGRPLHEAAFAREAGAAVLEKWELAEAMLGRGKDRGLSQEACLAEVKKRMSACGAVVRRPAEVRAEKARARELWLRARREMRVPSARGLGHGFKAIDLALTHAVYLEAVDEYLERGGRSRGSSLVPDTAGSPPHPLLGARWAYGLAASGDFVSTHILEVRLDSRGRFIKEWVPVRPVPRSGGWFESVWADYRDGRIVADDPVVAEEE
jgi:succinate dehydrogenase/fumarate reductase flavoprotein subunit